MKYVTFPPPPNLKGIVKFFWVFELDGIDGQPYVYRSMADGCAELVFHYKGSFREVFPQPDLAQSKAMLHAQTGQFRRFLTHENFGIFGAYIYPYALPRLFGYNSMALSDEMPDLVSLLGKNVLALEDQIFEAQTDLKRVAILADFLQNQLEIGSTKDFLAAKMVHQFMALEGKGSIKSFSEHVGISQRSLERRFKEYAGFSPKKYARILRFQAAIAKYGNKHPDLTQLALECGYFDQAHFIHDFREFSGYVPSAYFQGRPEGIEYKEI